MGEEGVEGRDDALARLADGKAVEGVDDEYITATAKKGFVNDAAGLFHRGGTHHDEGGGVDAVLRGPAGIEGSLGVE